MLVKWSVCIKKKNRAVTNQMTILFDKLTCPVCSISAQTSQKGIKSYCLIYVYLAKRLQKSSIRFRIHHSMLETTPIH